jgi:succinate-semialdehyde dehydrogenase / glutarate-semialdehyde dehydrogenase
MGVLSKFTADKDAPMRFATINPYNGRVIEEFEHHSDDKIIGLLTQSAQSFRFWRQTPLAQRAELFLKLADLLRNRLEGYAEAIVREMGKPIREARAEITKCAWVCEYYAQNAEKFLTPEPMPSDAGRSYLAYEPLGTVLAIMPWNFPFWQTFRFAAPALMAGNVALLKPAPNTTRCGLAIEELFRAAGFPTHAFQTVLADYAQVRHLIGSDYVQAVTLTGSERAGISVASAAGANIKKTVLELGGSDPFIVLDDADLNEAVKVAVASRMVNSGQSCIAAKRFIVSDRVVDKFIAQSKMALERLVMGDPQDSRTEIGPLARPDLVEQLRIQVELSVRKGAELVTGGTIDGNFYAPTLLANVRPGMPAFDQELFGPVMAVTAFQAEEEAIELANQSDFGLAASLWSQSPDRAARLVGQIEAGAVFVNAMVKSDPRLPFGGIKKSGYGRELSAQGIREFCNLKTVYIA